MHNLVVAATSRVTDVDLMSARIGPRFSRLDLMSQLVLLAVESLGLNFASFPRDRIGICLAALAGSLCTDVEYWEGRRLTGGPSPTLFAYTLPSAAIGELAIRFRLTGPNLCFVGDDSDILPEASDLIRRGEADACLCVSCNVLSAAAAELIQGSPAAEARAFFLTRKSDSAKALQVCSVVQPQHSSVSASA